MGRAAPLDPDLRRNTLLDAARVVFGAKGYHAASVADIIDEAGVARGTFYNHFDSKREVFQAVLDGMMEEVAAAVHPIDVRQPIALQVRENIGRLVTSLVGSGDLGRVLFTDAAGVDDEGRAALAEFYGRAEERIARALRTGQGLGVVRPCDVQVTARCLLGVIKEPVYQALLRREPLDPNRLADEVHALVFGGVWATSSGGTR